MGNERRIKLFTVCICRINLKESHLLLNLDRDCEMTVLPQPKAPGTAQVPPSTEGKRPSMTRSPVMRGTLPGSYGRERSEGGGG